MIKVFLINDVEKDNFVKRLFFRIKSRFPFHYFMQFKINFVFAGIILLIMSCTTLGRTEKEKPEAYITAHNEAFNPKSSNQKYNMEVFDIGKSPANKKIIKDWTIVIKDSEDNGVFAYQSTGSLIPAFSWDGKSPSNEICKDGVYYAVLTLDYLFEKPFIASSKQFMIDTAPLSVNIRLSTDMFSPGLIGKKDDVTITQDNATKQADWSGFIYNSSGIKVKTYSWNGEIPETIVWDGRDNNNKILPDGEYYYQVTALDKVGNYFESERFDKANLDKFTNRVNIFTKNILVNIRADLESFNPKGGNPGYNHQTFDLISNLAKDITILNWKVDIINSKGNSIYKLTGNGEFKPNLEWNGKLNSRDYAPDDDYYALLSANFNSGSSSVGQTKIFSIDTIIPKIEITPMSDIFSPNGDNILDTYEITQKGSKESNWTETITNEDNKVIWTKTYSGYPVPDENWDGKDNAGNLQPNGLYKYKITGIDKAGNMAKAENFF